MAKGSEETVGRLEGSVTLVAGGAGEVGEGLARAFLGEGATVIVPSRSKEKLGELRARLDHARADDLITIVGDVGELGGAEQVKEQIVERFGKLHTVVASLGGWWQGAPLTRVPLKAWQSVFNNNLTTHFIVARTFVPLVEAGGSYVFINGGAAVQPVPQAGPVSIFAAAQLMMKDVLAAEEENVRLYSLVVNTPIITRSRPQGRAGWLTADDVGKYAAFLASPDGAGLRGQTVLLNNRSQVAEQAFAGRTRG
jgi:NAD(P)-dependent dehydrogenase (short-subunit alcohol dehydrogenase family)